MMKQLQYRDPEGRLFAVQLPQEIPDNEASKGIRVGPPDLKPLRLPKETEIRLNNQLYARGLLTKADVEREMPNVLYAVQAALQVDANAVAALYE